MYEYINKIMKLHLYMCITMSTFKFMTLCL